MVLPTVTDLTPDLGWLLQASTDNERDQDYAHMAVAPGNEPKPAPEPERTML
jgi:hypothetical protein